jgi:hypothetical protein
VSVIWRLVLLVAFVGAVLYIVPLVTQKPAVAPAATGRAVAVVGPSAPAALSSGIATVDAALKQATQSGKTVPITLRVTDADLTAAARPYFPQSYAGFTVTDPAVRLGPALTLSAKASSFVLSGDLVASATPYAIDGRLALRLDSATVGGIALPEIARSQLQQQLQNALNASISARLQVTTVSIAPGVATIGGVALP